MTEFAIVRRRSAELHGFLSFPSIDSRLPLRLFSRRRSLKRRLCFGVIGIEAKRFSIRRDRIVAAAELCIGFAELIIRFGVLRIGFERQLEHFYRLLDFSLLQIDDAEIVLHVRIGRVQRDRPAEGNDSGFQHTFFEKGDSQGAVSIRLGA